MFQSSHKTKTSNDSLKEILDSMLSENFDAETEKKLEKTHSLCDKADTNVNKKYPNGDNDKDDEANILKIKKK